MAKAGFDFEKFKTLKMNKYLMQYCKPIIIKKAEAGIILIDYKMVGKKTKCIFIPIKKRNEAKEIFKQIKKTKEHLIKKTAFVAVKTKTNDAGKKDIMLKIINGGVSAELLKNKGANLFEKGIKMNLKVFGGAEDSNQEAKQESAETKPQEGAPSLGGAAFDAKQAFQTFKSELLPAIKENNLSPKQHEELKKISTTFEFFNQAIQNASKEEKAKFGKLMQAVQKAAALMLKVAPKKEEKGGDIINDDNVFSKEEKAAIQSLVKDIKTALPFVKKQIIPNLKAKKSTDEDKKILSGLIDNIARFNDNYEAAPAPVKEKLGKFQQTVSKKHKQLQAILNKLEGQAAQDMKAMLTPEQRQEIMSTAKSDVAQILKELEELKALAA